MTAHELARKLLEGPDLPVGFHDGDLMHKFYVPVGELMPGRVVDWELYGDEWMATLVDGIRLVGDIR